MPPSHRELSYVEYLAAERDSAMKHGFEGGLVTAVSAGSRRHNAVASRISAALETDRRAGGVAFQFDQRVRVLATGKATYPDVSMVCGLIEGDPADPSGATITNPTVLVEVLSASTEHEDRANKWQHHQLPPSRRECVIASQTEPRVERFGRTQAGGWEHLDVTAGEIVLTCGAVIDVRRLNDSLPA